MSGDFVAAPEPGAEGQGGGDPGPVRQFSTSKAFSFGWARFSSNVWPILLAVITAVVAVGAVLAVGLAVSQGLGFKLASSGSSAVGGVAWGVSTVLALAAGSALSVGFVRATLETVRGREVTLATVFSTDGLGRATSVALASSLIVLLGSVLCIVPGIAAAFFLQFALLFSLDQNLSLLKAIKASAALVRQNAGAMFVFFVVAMLASLIGMAACYVGWFVAVPVTGIATAYVYRILIGEGSASQ